MSPVNKMDPEENMDDPEADFELVEDEVVQVIDLDDDDEDGLAAGLEDVDVESDDEGDVDDNGEMENEREDGAGRDDAEFAFMRHTASVFSISLDPMQQTLAVSGGEDDKAYVWQVADGKVVFECTGHKDSVTCTGFSYDSKFVATGDMSGIIKVWDVQSGQEVWDFECSDLEWLEWHHGTHVLFAGTADGDVWMWKVPSGNCKTYQNHGCKTTCGMLMRDGKRTVVGYEDGTVKVWDLKEGKQTFHLSDPTSHTGAVNCIDCHIDDIMVATGSEDSTVKLVNTSSGKVVLTLAAGIPQEDSEDSAPSIEALGFSAIQPTLATASLSGVLGLWDLHSYRVKHQCKHPEGLVRLKWDPGCETLLYTACLDGIIRLWDSRSGNCEREWVGHEAEILDLAVAKDGSFMITASGDGSARKFTVNSPGR